MTSLGRRKPKANVCQIFCERYPKQVLYFLKVNTNGKLETRTKGIVDKCSYVTCTKKDTLTEGQEREGGGGVNVGHSLSPPSHFLLATGLFSKWKIVRDIGSLCAFKRQVKTYHLFYHSMQIFLPFHWLKAHHLTCK